MKKQSSWKKLAKRLSSKDDKDGAEDLSSNLDNIDWDVDSELVIKFLTLPSSKNYAALRRQLEKCRPEWMTEFLSHDGLNLIFIALRQMAERSYIRFADAVLQLELVRCIKAVMNSKVGMEFVVENGVLVHNLILGEQNDKG